MSKEEQARLWRQKIRGWQQVAEIVDQEEKARDASRDMDVLFQAARAFPRDAVEEAEIEQVRQTWIRIKRASRKS